jgi:feruloyl esterase
MERVHDRKRIGWLMAGGAGLALLAGVSAPTRAQVSAPVPTSSTACTAALAVNWPEKGTRIERANPVGAGLINGDMIPAHCDLYGIMHEHKGVDGQDYAIRFHMRLPEAWNGRFFFQGGGGPMARSAMRWAE